MLSHRAILVTLAAMLWVMPTDVGAQPPPVTPLGPGFDATAYTNQLKVTTFASGLNYPAGMQQYDGGILVGTTNGAFANTSTNSGHLLLLTDTTGSGVANQRVDLTPTTGLPGDITSLQFAGNLLFVTSNVLTSNPVISVLRPGATPTSPFVSLGSINLNFPTVNSTAWEHVSFGLTARPTPGQAGNYDVLFNLGSRTNQTSDETSDGSGVYTQHVGATTSGSNVSGFGSASLNPESIYMTTVSYNGTTAGLSSPVQVAHGLRNAVGMAFQPGTGNLYFADNGMDGSTANGHPNDGYGNAAYSLDTLHTIANANIGTSFPKTNFAYDFYENTPQTYPQHGSPDAIAKFAPFGPFDSTNHNSSPNESEGPNGIAFSPPNFPSALQGIFIGFHGQYDVVGPPNTTTHTGNEEDPVVFYNTTTGQYWDFIGTNEPDIGHLDGMLSTSNALFMSDLADANGALTGSNPTLNAGAIYEITVVPEPSTLVLTAIALAPLWMRRRTLAQ